MATNRQWQPPFKGKSSMPLRSAGPIWVGVGGSGTSNNAHKQTATGRTCRQKGTRPWFCRRQSATPWRQVKIGLMLKGLADLKCCGAQEPDQTSLARSHLPSVLQVRSFSFCACALLCVAGKRCMLSVGVEASCIFCHGQDEEGMSQRIAPIDNDTPHFTEKDPAIQPSSPSPHCCGFIHP